MTHVSGPATEPLLRAAGSHLEDLRAAIDHCGAEETADILVEEILARCEPPPLDRPVTVALDLVHDGQPTPYRFTFSGAAATAARSSPNGSEGPEGPDGLDGRAQARIRYELTALARALYGPGRSDHGFNVEVCWPPPDDLGEVFASISPLARAVESLLSACRHDEPNLDRLATRFGSDKWGCLHWYTPHYAHHFAPLRDEPVRLLEIGIGGYHDPRAGGSSLRMWQRYFRRGLIYGLDLFPKLAVRGPRIRTLEGDQSDPEVLAGIAREYGPFDIVIDDGSHINDHVLTSLRELFGHVRTGGLYVIEDVQTSYWPGFGGAAGRPAAAGTTLGFVGTLLDGLHHSEMATPAGGGATSDLERHVVGLHVYHNLVFLEKGVNDEQGAPSWIPR